MDSVSASSLAEHLSAADTSDDGLSGLFPLIAATAAAGVTALTLLQTDRISRKLLKPQTLEIKRRREYSYHWKIAMEKVHLQLSYFLAGGAQNYNADPECILKQTDYLSTDNELEGLLHKLLDKNSNSRFTTLKLSQDPDDPSGEYDWFLLEDIPSKTAPRILYQVPLRKFGLKLHKLFDDQLTATTFCFVADASSGKATKLLEQVCVEAKTGVAIVSEPLWMSDLATIITKKAIKTETLEKLLFALCRFEAWSLRKEVMNSKTVIITLPGQSTTPALLPLLQKVFPEDRHVFGYDTCSASVYRGYRLSKQYKRGHIEDRLTKIVCGGMCSNPIRHTTPLMGRKILTNKVLGLTDALSELPVEYASTVETWMASVDTFFTLKENEWKNGYLPYVWKLSFMTQPDDDQYLEGSDSYWGLRSLLQYVTGCRSGGLSEGTMDAAREFLRDYNSSQQEEKHAHPLFASDERKRIDNCVFCHKLILIENKTLQDTVLPRQHWTLKQASKKGGCACCGPDPLDDEEEKAEEERQRQQQLLVERGKTAGMMGMTAATSTSSSNKPSTSSGFVDGKLGFAFDPSRFS